MRRDCDEGIALNMNMHPMLRGLAKRKQLFLTWITGLIQQLERYVGVNHTLEITGKDCNET